MSQGQDDTSLTVLNEAAVDAISNIVETQAKLDHHTSRLSFESESDCVDQVELTPGLTTDDSACSNSPADTGRHEAKDNRLDLFKLAIASDMQSGPPTGAVPMKSNNPLTMSAVHRICRKQDELTYRLMDMRTRLNTLSKSLSDKTVQLYLRDHVQKLGLTEHDMSPAALQARLSKLVRTVQYDKQVLRKVEYILSSPEISSRVFRHGHLQQQYSTVELSKYVRRLEPASAIEIIRNTLNLHRVFQQPASQSGASTSPASLLQHSRLRYCLRDGDATDSEDGGGESADEDELTQQRRAGQMRKKTALTSRLDSSASYVYWHKRGAVGAKLGFVSNQIADLDGRIRHSHAVLHRLLEVRNRVELGEPEEDDVQETGESCARVRPLAHPIARRKIRCIEQRGKSHPPVSSHCEDLVGSQSNSTHLTCSCTGLGVAPCVLCKGQPRRHYADQLIDVCNSSELQRSAVVDPARHRGLSGEAVPLNVALLAAIKPSTRCQQAANRKRRRPTDSVLYTRSVPMPPPKQTRRVPNTPAQPSSSVDDPLSHITSGHSLFGGRKTTTASYDIDNIVIDKNAVATTIQKPVYKEIDTPRFRESNIDFDCEQQDETEKPTEEKITETDYVKRHKQLECNEKLIYKSYKDYVADRQVAATTGVGGAQTAGEIEAANTVLDSALRAVGVGSGLDSDRERIIYDYFTAPFPRRTFPLEDTDWRRIQGYDADTSRGSPSPQHNLSHEDLVID